MGGSDFSVAAVLAIFAPRKNKAAFPILPILRYSFFTIPTYTLQKKKKKTLGIISQPPFTDFTA